MAAAAVPTKDASAAAAADSKTGDDAAKASAVEWLHAYLPRDSDVWAELFRAHDIVTVHDVLLLDAQDLYEMLSQRATRPCDWTEYPGACDGIDVDPEQEDDALHNRFLSARTYYLKTTAPYSTRVDAAGRAVPLTDAVLSDLRAATPRRKSLYPNRDMPALMAAR